MRILVIEDDSSHQVLLKSWLREDESNEVYIACSKRKAIAALKEIWDLVICDCLLPDSGVDDDELDRLIELCHRGALLRVSSSPELFDGVLPKEREVILAAIDEARG